ncbi:cytosine-specific methyltransferase [Kocuria dechangensis]|uniref:DNA (cytosine-5-)-methyltransferase n=1 Tax=Kocuria dechangensis TaxID=1176249 RepID=A0A917LZJ5_9MICC|nr:cytosine-specific methyltransferase [Kocuria dechangensis]
MDLLDFDPRDHHGLEDIDLLSAGLPRVQASAASNRSRGSSHELELLMATVKLAQSLRPRALLIDNVAELAVAGAYGGIREQIHDKLAQLGYRYKWFVLNAVDFQVPQDRKHGFLVALQGDLIDGFQVPSPSRQSPPTTGEALLASMASRGWAHAAEWARLADKVAPTVVGGSWERGGADLGPTGSKRAWARIGVDGGTVADEVPGPDFSWDPSLGRSGMMALTTAQVARLQGFPAEWLVAGRKTARYRQVANASPPPLAQAVGEAIVTALAST